MDLATLLLPWNISVSCNCAINDLQNDSRKIKPGDVFIAYPGALTDGRLYMQKAAKAGAVAILYDPDSLPGKHHLPTTIPCIPITHLAHKIPELACRLYQHGQATLSITGITGTNGKTTIAYQLAQAWQLLGKSARYIGTLGEGMVTQLSPLENTTPDALCLQQLLHRYTMDAAEQVCMEVSSHALALDRVRGIDFKQAIFTNLTQDHLDFHKTMENYAAAKARLFTNPALQWAICNGDDPWFPHFQQVIKSPTRLLTYGLQGNCDVIAKHWQMDLSGTHIQIQSPVGDLEIHINALGKFNVYNTLAIVASLLAEDISPEKIIHIMPQLKAAPGRMEIVAQKPCVVVDYAHTPDALANVLHTLEQIKNGGKLWVIFGCGGDRDTTKRPLMGEAASQYADKIVLTSDNPRNEVPEKIIEDILPGIDASRSVQKIVDRKMAIEETLNQADSRDIILIAGKGHENYQQIGQVKRPFSDQDIVRNALKIYSRHLERSEGSPEAGTCPIMEIPRYARMTGYSKAVYPQPSLGQTTCLPFRFVILSVKMGQPHCGQGVSIGSFHKA